MPAIATLTLTDSAHTGERLLISFAQVTFVREQAARDSAARVALAVHFTDSRAVELVGDDAAAFLAAFHKWATSDDGNNEGQLPKTTGPVKQVQDLITG